MGFLIVYGIVAVFLGLSACYEAGRSGNDCLIGLGLAALWLPVIVISLIVVPFILAYKVGRLRLAAVEAAIAALVPRSGE